MGQAAQVGHGVDGGGATDYAATGPIGGAVVQARIWGSGVAPIDAGIGEGFGIAEGRFDPELVV